MSKELWWQLKKSIFHRVIRLSNAIFGKELLHRSRIARFLHVSWRNLFENISPAHRRQARFEKANPDLPWLVPRAIREIEKQLKPDYVGFEWGSGRSTLWFARQVAHITSVEGRRSWFENVSKMLAQKGLAHKVKIILSEVTTEHDFKSDEIERYAGTIDQFEDHSFDFIVVDGHFREACLKSIGNKLRRRGILIVDNSDILPNTWLDALLPYTSKKTWNNGIHETTIIYL
ncbi:MAG: class I SAM-dependent methyltransferase [Azoarcus sp.]|nr:class I SAM-dependent methyltransferase [Azoarcus sp.]